LAVAAEQPLRGQRVGARGLSLLFSASMPSWLAGIYSSCYRQHHAQCQPRVEKLHRKKTMGFFKKKLFELSVNNKGVNNAYFPEAL